MTDPSPFVDSTLAPPIPRIMFDRCHDRLVARLSGSLDVYTAERVSESLGVIDPASEDLVIDLTAVRMVDSAGLMALRRMAIRFERCGHSLLVQCPEGPVCRALAAASGTVRLRMALDIDEPGGPGEGTPGPLASRVGVRSA